MISRCACPCDFSCSHCWRECTGEETRHTHDVCLITSLHLQHSLSGAREKFHSFLFEQLYNIIPGSLQIHSGSCLMRTILVPTHRPPPHGPWLGNVWTRPCWRSAGWAGLTDWRSASWSVSAGGLARRSPAGPRTGRTWACQGAGCWCTGSTTGSPPGSRRNLEWQIRGEETQGGVSVETQIRPGREHKVTVTVTSGAPGKTEKCVA